MNNALIKKNLQDLGINRSMDVKVGPPDENGMVKVETEFVGGMSLTIEVIRVTSEKVVATLITDAAQQIWPKK